MAAVPSPELDVIPSHQLTVEQRGAIIALCEACFAEDFSTFFASLGDSMHLLVWDGCALVAHACWVTRWLQPEGLPLLRTAYVKAVAVALERQRQGWGTLAMRQLCEHAAGYELCALSTIIPEYYARLGWEQWRGPTAIRMADGLLPTPDESPMVLRTARTPPLDLDALLTAEWRIGELW